jgi:hypothetical protein
MIIEDLEGRAHVPRRYIHTCLEVLGLSSIAGVFTEIQTDHFPNTNQEPFHCDVTLSDAILFSSFVWGKPVIRNGCRGALSILLPLVVNLYSIWSPPEQPYDNKAQANIKI